MPKAFSDHEKEMIHSQMREKGKALFEKQGLKKTSVDELTEAVGISKGAFYLFYESEGGIVSRHPGAVGTRNSDKNP